MTAHHNGYLALVDDSTYQPASAMRKAMAIVSATIQRDHDRAQEYLRELAAPEARFALAVTAEYLSEAIHRLALMRDDTADEVWQRYCLQCELAIQRVADRGLASG